MIEAVPEESIGYREHDADRRAAVCRHIRPVTLQLPAPTTGRAQKPRRGPQLRSACTGGNDLDEVVVREGRAARVRQRDR